jgi:PTS system galactitol-specific IIC component
MITQTLNLLLASFTYSALSYSTFQAGVSYFLSLGAATMMPVILFFLAIAFRVPWQKAARYAVTVGVGFVGIFALLDFVLPLVGTMVHSLVIHYHISMVGVDIGWPLTAAITWAVPFSFIIIPLGFIINVLVLIPGFTKTFDADIWNYWHWAFTAVMAYFFTRNLILAFIIAIITELLVLKLADWTLPLAQKFFNIPGASLPHTETVDWSPLNLAFEKLIGRRLKILQKYEKIKPTTLSERLGYLGEPVMIGFYIGVVLGIIAQLSWGYVLELGVYVAALMMLEGRMVGVLMEGLYPIAMGAREYISKSERFKNRELAVGIDGGAIGNANPPSIAIGYMLIPLYYVWAVVLASAGLNRVLPLADVIILPCLVMWSVASSKGNIVKSILNAFLINAPFQILIMSAFAAPLTEAALSIHYALPAGIILASSLDAGAHILPFILIYPIYAVMTHNYIALAVTLILAIIYFGSWAYARDMPKRITDELVAEEATAVPTQ